jgi:hypothetical protein
MAADLKHLGFGLVCVLGLLGTGCSGDKQTLFTQPKGSGPKSCDVTGTWATFVEVGVGWQSGTIKPGAGTVKQWIVSHRTQTPTGGVQDVAHVCGIGAQGVPLGSAWFSTIDVPQLMPPVVGEWTGTEFLAALFDRGKTPAVTLATTVTGQDPTNASLGDQFTTNPEPFQLGVEGLAGDTPWPDAATMLPMVVDHDGDGAPGMSGMPFQGPVAGEPPGTVFKNPRLAIPNDSPRTSQLYLALRTRAALNGKLTSCDPARFEGKVVGSTLVIEVRNVGCVVADTKAPCSTDQANWIDSNLPQFKFNGTSNVVSIKVADDSTCEEVRTLKY